jgi:hypothetical protein
MQITIDSTVETITVDGVVISLALLRNPHQSRPAEDVPTYPCREPSHCDAAHGVFE